MKAAVDALRARLTGWSYSIPDGLAVQVFWPNESNVVPDDGAFVFAEIIGDKSAGPEAFGAPGNHEWKWPGELLLHVFVSSNRGIELAHAISDDLATRYRGQRFSGVTCFSADTLGGGNDADREDWWKVTLSVDFVYRYRG